MVSCLALSCLALPCRAGMWCALGCGAWCRVATLPTDLGMGRRGWGHMRSGGLIDRVGCERRGDGGGEVHGFDVWWEVV